MAAMEELHRKESSGSRGEQLEQEQNKKENDSRPRNCSESSSNSKDPIEELEDYLAGPALPRDIIEPAINLTIDSCLEDMVEDDAISMSLLEASSVFKEIEGDNDDYPDV